MFTIKWIGPDGSLKAQDSGEEEARLLVDGEYEEGDRLCGKHAGSGVCMAAD